MSNQENIFYEKDGDTSYSITKGLFYIKDLNAKMNAFRVMKHTNYSKPIVEYVFQIFLPVVVISFSSYYVKLTF